MKKLDNNIYEIENSDVKDLLKERNNNSNKGDFGKAGIYGGSIEYPGALKLSFLALSALRSGCGISRVIINKELLPLLSSSILEQTLFILQDYNNDFYSSLSRAIKDLDSLAFGMGLGSNNCLEDILKFLIENYHGNLIIDADGINALAKMNLDILRKKKCNILLTPHLKEFSRLCKKDIEMIKKDSLNLVKEFASSYKVTVLLKGHTTILSDGNIIYLITTGCAGMATSGSGDVLSGILSGFLAYLDFNMLSISTGIIINGLAGCLAEKENTDISMLASDTINNISMAIKTIRES